MTNWSSSWVVLQWAAAALVVALVLPFLLPASRRHAGAAVRLALGLAVGLALLATGASTTEVDGPGEILHLTAVLALVCGLVGVAGLFLFDLLLPAVRVVVPSLLKDVIQVLVAGVAVMVCLRMAGLDVLPLLTTSAVLTAVIGLALQAPIANVFGGLALQLDRTLIEGDWIETGRYSGRIVDIGWRSTRVITKEGDTLFLPNSQLLSGEVLNLSRPTGAHRTSVRVSVHEGHPPGVVRQFLLDAIRDVPGVLAYPVPDVVIVDLAEDAVLYDVRYWLTEFERDAAIASEVRARLWYATRRAGLEPPAKPREIGAAETIDEHAGGEEDRLHLLNSAEVFTPLDGEGRARLAAKMRRLEFTASEPIFHQGMAGDAVYLIGRGEVGVRVDVEGLTAEVARLGRGEIFGEMALLTGEPRSASCVARSEVTCYAIDRAVFRQVLDANPAVAEAFATRLSSLQAAYEAQREALLHAARERPGDEKRSGLQARLRGLFRNT